MARSSTPLPSTSGARLMPRPFLRGVDDARELLLQAARDLFLEAGPSAFSLREVARRVGVSPAAVYRHFDGKQALLNAACRQGFQVFSTYLVRALSAPTPLARLLAATAQYRAFALESPLDYRFIFMTPIEQVCIPSGGTLELDAPESATFRFLVDRVSECMQAKVLRPADPGQTALQIWAHVHGLVSLRISSHLAEIGDEAAFAAFYALSVERLLRGLSA